ncbi:MAG: peptidoglycan-binding protein [Acidobacteria bacterium]|nr:MAG: peptidoglycan-binding protein [Acidobacteriota bacterium]
MNKKLVSVVLTATTVVWGLGIATLPLANAQTTASLQAQIAALLAQIQQLQAQLNSAKGTSTSTSYSFTRDLTVGSKGADVSALQQVLINAGYLKISAPTAYFGSMTKAALAKYQAANGVKPAAGYFGPITRAFIASSSVAGAGTGTGTGTGSSTSTTVTPPTTGLAVSLASNNPSAGSLITTASGSTGGTAARVPVLSVNLTASNSGAVTVTDLKFHKTGVLSDSSISGAYLIQNGQVLYQYTSLNNGVIDFSSMNLTVPAGQTEELQLAIDPSSGLQAGNTVSFAMNAASDVTAVDSSNNSVTASGSFPLNGSIFTVTTVSNPSLAQLTVTSTPVGTQVTAGTQNNIVSAWQLTGSNSLVYLKGLKFEVIGSANDADIRNVKLNINGTQVGPTLATVGSNGVAYFDLSSSPASINTGSNNLQVYADVMGSPSKDFAFEILNSYDVYAVDSQYNVPISVTANGGSGTDVSIAKGTITVTADSATPTGNIAVGQSGVTLAKFDIYAAGEPVKVKFLDFELDFTTSTSNPTLKATLSDAVQNIALVDDAGGQVGSTINNPPSTNDCATNKTAAYSTSTGTYKDCFGTSASPINYIVPANTTRVLSLKADIQSGATFATVQAKLNGDTSNLQGLTSSQTNSSAATNGSALTLQTGLLTVTENTSYGNQTIQPGTSNVKIGSYSFSASSASGVQMNTVSVKVYPSASGSNDIANLKLMIGGTQFGTTQPVVTDQSTYTFSGSPFTIPAGGTTNVDVYADLLSGATTTAQTASEVTACTGTSVVSYNSVSCPSGAVTGQSVTASSAGANVTVGLDSSAPAASQLVANTTGNTLAAFRFTETSNVANVNITDLKVTQNTSSSAQDFGNVTLYNGSTNLGTGVAATSSAGWTYTFHFSTAPQVPQNRTLVLTLKGDVPPYSSGGVADNTTSTFGFAATSDVTALTAGSQKAAVVSGTPTGNVMTVLQTTLTPSAVAIDPATGNVRKSVDNAATITVTAASGGSAVLRSLKLTFSGSAITASTSVSDFALLYNSVDVTTSTANSGLGASVTGTCSASPCSLTWTFPTSTTNSAVVVTGGGSQTFTLRFNSADFATATGQNPVSINAVINGTGDMTYYDNSQATGSTISLPVTIVPLQIVTVSYSS